MHPPPPLGKKEGEGSGKKNMVWGARFQKLRGEPYYQLGLNSERGRGGGGSNVFMQTCSFCGNIVINYSYHYVYSNVFDIAESLIQNNHGSI